MTEDYSQVLVCMPTYNERENVANMIDKVSASIPGASIMVIDDSSPDGTGELVDEMAARMPTLHVMHRPAKSGLATAYLDAFAYGISTGYDYMVEIDADGSHAPEHLPAMLAAAQFADTGLVIGSRYVAGGRTEGWPASRKLLSRAGNTYVKMMMGLPVRDATGGYRVYRATTLRQIDLSEVRSRGYSFQVEMTMRAAETGTSIVETPIVFTDRQFGSSKMSRSVVAEALWRTTVWGTRKRLRRPPSAQKSPANLGRAEQAVLET